MSKINRSVLELVGKTPLLKANRYAENAGKNMVVLLPDSGDRYLSTPLFSEGAF